MIDRGRQYTAFMEAIPQKLDEFTSQQGTMRLYHYSSMVSQAGFSVDPKRFAQSSYSSNEYQRSSYPRSFFYLDPIKDKELVVPPNMYFVDYEASLIYNILADPEGVKARVKYSGSYNFDEMFKIVHQELGYSGMYTYPNMHVVVLFEETFVKPVPDFESDPFLTERMTQYVSDMVEKEKPMSNNTLEWAKNNGIPTQKDPNIRP